MTTKHTTPRRRLTAALGITVLLAAAHLDLTAAEFAQFCPPQRFQSNVNILPNPDFENIGPCGPFTFIGNGGGNCILAGIAWSAANGWRMHGDNAGHFVQSTVEPSTLPIGGLARMLHIRALGPESGVYQPFQMPNGAHNIMFSVWVKVMRGQVVIGTNSMVNIGPYAWSTKTNEWEQLRVCTNGSPVDMLFIYNANWATGEGEFFADRFEVKVID